MMNLTLDLKAMTEHDHFQAFSSSFYFGFVIPSNYLIYKSKAKFSGSYAPVKVNPDPPPWDMWGFSGALSPYCQLFESPVCGGFARFVAFVLRNVGHL